LSSSGTAGPVRPSHPRKPESPIMWHIHLMWLAYYGALDGRTLFIVEEGNVLKSNCQEKCSNKLNQIRSALNLTSLQLMFSEELFMLKSRLAQLHGAVSFWTQAMR